MLIPEVLGLASSSGRPAEASPSEEMEVDVEHAIARVGPGVEDESEAPLRQAKIPGEVAASPNQRSHERIVLGGQVQKAREVFLGDQQDVDGGFGPDVVEGQNGVVLVDHPRGDPARDDLAEEARHEATVYTLA
jgi:hypothetical protein